MDYLQHRREHINAGRPEKQKVRTPIKKISDKLAAKRAEEKAARAGQESELVKWFRARIREMSGRCAETGLKTETRIYEYAIMSICHILPKSLCKSVALHPANWIELNCDFHKKFDAMSWEEREKLGCWPEIQDRLMLVWPDLAISERRHFPDSVIRAMRTKSGIDPLET